MVKGIFQEIHHAHNFQALAHGSTIMLDAFRFRAPLGPLGTLAEKLFLICYMRRLLLERNQFIKELAERNEPASRG
jgi:ligand-binding SRPBCC domain-containing protein